MSSTLCGTVSPILVAAAGGHHLHAREVNGGQIAAQIADLAGWESPITMRCAHASWSSGADALRLGGTLDRPGLLSSADGDVLLVEETQKATRAAIGLMMTVMDEEPIIITGAAGRRVERSARPLLVLAGTPMARVLMARTLYARDPIALTDELRSLVKTARQRSASRWGECGFTQNRQVSGAVLRSPQFLSPQARDVLEAHVRIGRLADSQGNRALQVAWTLADLGRCDRLTPELVEDACQLAGTPAN